MAIKPDKAGLLPGQLPADGDGQPEPTTTATDAGQLPPTTTDAGQLPPTTMDAGQLPLPRGQPTQGSTQHRDTPDLVFGFGAGGGAYGQQGLDGVRQGVGEMVWTASSQPAGFKLLVGDIPSSFTAETASRLIFLIVFYPLHGKHTLFDVYKC